MKKFNLVMLFAGIFVIMSTSVSQAETDPKMKMGDMSSGLDMSKCHEMMMKKLDPADQNYDLRFIDMMIPHHQMAVMMSQDALQKAQHPKLRQMAQDIINNQTREIEQLKAWRCEWYGK